jgi:alkylhydroperoxidase family enzyme
MRGDEADVLSDDLSGARPRLGRIVGAQHFEALRRHFDEPQIVELVAVCALFGFLNR